MNMKEIINLTPHEITIFKWNGEIWKVLPKSEQPLRLLEKRQLVDFLNGEIPINEVSFINIDGNQLPEQKEGVYYIVSRMIADAFKRPDFLVPDDLVRNDKGMIIGCKAFSIVK
jgi:hypothetical protein